MTMLVEVVTQQTKDTKRTEHATVTHTPGLVTVWFRGRNETFDNLTFALKWLMGFGYVSLSTKKIQSA